MLGTGLTMMDIALDLAARGVRLPLFAVSRHGLLPRAHRTGPPASPADARPPGLEQAPRARSRGTPASSAATSPARAETGGDWRDVIAALRAVDAGALDGA